MEKKAALVNASRPMAMPKQIAGDLVSWCTKQTAHQDAASKSAAAGSSVLRVSTTGPVDKNVMWLMKRVIRAPTPAMVVFEKSSKQNRKMTKAARNSQKTFTSLTVLVKCPFSRSTFL